MLRTPILASLCFGLACLPAAGQQAVPLQSAPDGGVFAGELIGQSENDDLNTAARPTSSVIGLRSSLNTSVAEEGSTGLSGAGRVLPVRPFSDRLAAVSKIGGDGATGLDASVYGGDTTFDAASGFRIGRFTILPEITLGVGWTDNVEQSAGGSPGKLYNISPNITGTSDWSRHQLDFALRGTYAAYPDSSESDDPSLTAGAGLRLDISDQTTANADVSYTYSREDASSAESAFGADDAHQLSGSLGVTRDAGLIAATVSTGIDRNTYTAEQGSSNTGDRDNTLYSASLRLDSNGGGTFSPFVEGSLLLRRFDETCSDALCERRDANGYQVMTGLAIAAGPKVTGEVGVGWRVEDIEDQRLNNLQGLVVDGSLVWSPSRLTTITGGLGTSFETTDIDGASGSIIYSADLRAAHGFSDRIAGELGVGYSYRTYQGASIDERTFTGLAGLTFALTKNIALETQYTYQKFTSTSANSDYDNNTIEAGLRFRH